MIIELIASSLIRFLEIYFYLLLARVLLSWFPNINWMNQPFAALSQITDPYLNMFRSIIPPLGGFDLSPILAILALQFGQWAIATTARVAITAATPMFY